MTITQNDHINAILSGDTRGLNRIYDLYLNRIARFIQSNGGSSDDAKDVFQDALIIIYEKAQQSDFLLSSQFYTFLYGVCRNIWGNRLKKKKPEGVIFSEDDTYISDEDIQQRIEAEEERTIFWDAFNQLSSDSQRLLQLFFEKKKMEEIKVIMGYGSVNYTKKRKHLCQKKLMTLIRNDSRFLELENKPI